VEQTGAGTYRPGDQGPRWRSLLGRGRPGTRDGEVAYGTTGPPAAIPPARTAGRGRGGRGPDRPLPTQIGGVRPAAFGGSVDELIAALRRDFGRARVVAFVNPKGGVHKTTATVLTAATLGSARGGGVLAWDDNELRGTLGLRAGTARHARTIRHLVDDLAAVEGGHGRLAEALEDYLRHTRDGSFDVLAGDEDPRIARRLDPATVRRVLTLLSSSHDVICVDTGNNVESPNWQTVLRAADQLVVTSVPREDAAFTADWMLDLLIEEGMGDLVSSAVTLLSCPTPNRSDLQDDLVKHFATRTRTSVVVPYDPALEPGSTIQYSALQPATRLAWLYAGVAITDTWGPARQPENVSQER
jgi:MinD-like ATPase involved in chromosome partitioning or flagellar assembly